MSLEITNLHKRFGETVALDGISFSVEPGQVFGFLGANGAGKTTTMRIALDIIRADEGTVTWGGRDSTEVPRRTWGYLPEEREHPRAPRRDAGGPDGPPWTGAEGRDAGRAGQYREHQRRQPITPAMRRRESR